MLELICEDSVSTCKKCNISLMDELIRHGGGGSRVTGTFVNPNKYKKRAEMRKRAKEG